MYIFLVMYFSEAEKDVDVSCLTGVPVFVDLFELS